MSSIALPARYRAIRRLGTGGGGEVWEVEDHYSEQHYALKVLAEDATEHEMAALVRETVALSGLEGIGLPRVMRFGRLPQSDRPYLVRELVDGKSLDELMAGKAATQRILVALAKAAEQLTLVHRAGFFHGDIKPANVIVGDAGDVTLVDLGLAAPWRDAGVPAPGLTPKYAAPELLGGRPLTVRAEVYALGVTLRDAVERGETSLGPQLIRDLLLVAQRATAVEPEQRFPSADEFASSLRRASLIEQAVERVDPTTTWPIVGNEATASRLVQMVCSAAPGTAIVVRGPAGSGKRVLLRRLAWSLGIEGRALVWFDNSGASDVGALREEIESFPRDRLTIIADDGHGLSDDLVRLLRESRSSGAVVVTTGDACPETDCRVFDVPPLGEHVAIELLRRAVPSLTERLAKQIVNAVGCIPGRLKRAVSLIDQHAAASEDDIERLLSGVEATESEGLPEEPLALALHLLQRGRYSEAQVALERVEHGDELVIATARARLNVGLGELRAAYDELEAIRDLAESRHGTPEAVAWQVWLGRANVGLARYNEALALLTPLRDQPGELGAFALAFEGLALSHIDKGEAARDSLTRAVEVARAAKDVRVEGFVHSCVGTVLHHAGDAEGAQAAYERALHCAQNGGDASTVGTVQLNLAVLHKQRGDVATAIEHYEAAADMGRRSGRRATVRNALLNLANLDLFLGRLARARASIEAVEEQRETLPAVARAQLSGVQAELFERMGDDASAIRCYRECALEWEAQGSGVRGAEARLEAVLVAARSPELDVQALATEVARAKAQLGDNPAHRSLVALASAKVCLAAGDEGQARAALDEGLQAAHEAQQKDWEWRILAARAELEAASGKNITARRDRIEAVTVLEQIGARLPRDLREVFWNDPRRRALRASVDVAMGSAETHVAYSPIQVDAASLSLSVTASASASPLEQRLGKLLEINRELLGEVELPKLTARVIEHAVELLRAERGCVILREADGTLQVYSSSTRPGDTQHLEFSRSIAERVIQTREPFVSTSARDDQRMRGFHSVHQMHLESVVCVPITARYQEPLGALYVENRHESNRGFHRELPTLRAFADQVALAFETARLISENAQRAEQLERANEQLKKAQRQLKEALGARTERLRETRRKLRETEDTLYGHFGYQGMVGTSTAMRRCYSLIERIKDTDVPVLLTGESGTGKEVAARAIHRASTRSKKPFLGINCGAIPEHLLESELFGHVRGAFTGADRDKKGLFREASGGAVLLDEIGEMPHKMQAGLLRVLQEHKVRPVGGTVEEPVDCRFIFATHRDLDKLVREGKFREDLYYRIHVVELPLPPLRERLDDIPLLVDHFLSIFAARYKRDRKGISRSALRALMQYAWPGNVRQLEHTLLNAWVLCEGDDVERGDLELPGTIADDGEEGIEPGDDTDSFDTEGSAVKSSDSQARRAGEGELPRRPSRQTLSSHRRSEKERIIEALEACNWNRVKAAELSGIPRRTFYRRLREYEIL